MKFADVTTLVVVVGALVLVGVDKMDLETLLALLGGVLLRSPLPMREQKDEAVD